MTSAKQSGPTTFSEMLAPIPEPTRKIATQLRTIIKAALPQADEAFYGGAKMGMVLYSIDGPNNVICGIQPTDKMCKLFFHGWKHLVESGYRMEGSGKNARHIKIRSSQELKAEEIARMINIAKIAVGK